MHMFAMFGRIIVAKIGEFRHVIGVDMPTVFVGRFIDYERRAANDD